MTRGLFAVVAVSAVVACGGSGGVGARVAPSAGAGGDVGAAGAQKEPARTGGNDEGGSEAGEARRLGGSEAGIEGYAAVEPKLSLHGDVAAIFPVERGRCYKVAVRFADGSLPKEPVRYEHQRFVRSIRAFVSYGWDAKAGAGSEMLLDLGCVFLSQSGLLTIKGARGVKAEAQVYVRPLAEEEMGRLEAEEAARWKKASEREARAFAATQKGKRCKRCGEGYMRCLEGVEKGKQPASGSCLQEYIGCLDEERGGGMATLSECASYGR